MSIKPISIDEEAVENRSLRMFAHSWNGIKISAEETNINGINYSTPDLGQPNYSLHTDGAGNTFWAPDETTGGDILYNGADPIQVGTIAKYSSTSGLTVDDSKMIETATELQVNNLRITGVTDPVDDQDVVTKKYYEDTLSANTNNEHTTTGVNTGGVLSLNGVSDSTPTFNISDGSGIINNLNVITKISWSGLSGISRTTDPNNPAPYNGIITYIAINNLGQVIYSDSAFTNQQQRENIFIGVVVHITSPSNLTGQNITVVNNEQLPTLNTGNQIKDVMKALGFINISGNQLSASTLLTFQKSIGYMLGNGINYANNIKDPHTLTLNSFDTNAGGIFQYRMQDGTSSALNLTNIIPNLLDNGPYPGGTYGNNQWGVNRVYMFVSQACKIQPPQFSYNTAELAIEGIGTENFNTEPSIQANGLLIGYIITRGGATDLNNTGDTRFLTAGKFGSGVGTVVGGTQNLQSVYDNSTNPEIVTDITRQAVTIRRGSALDTNNVFECQEGVSGNNTFQVQGDGVVKIGVSGSEFTLPNTRGTNGQFLQTDVSGIVTWQNQVTNLSEGSVTNTTVNVDSSTGSSATLQPASTSRAGVLSKEKFDEIVANTLKVSNVSTNLSEGTVTNTTVDVNSSDGTNATLLEASTSRAGVLSKAKFDEIVANTAKVSNVTTNLSQGTRTATTVDVNSSDGTNATLDEATGSLAGVLSSADKTKLDGLTVSSITNAGTTSLVSNSNGALKGLVAGTNITFGTSGTDVTINSSGGGGGGGLDSFSNYSLPSSTGAIPSSGSFNASLVQVHGDVTVSSMQVLITTASAGKTIYAGIYNQSGNTLLGESAINAASTGLQSNTLVGGGTINLTGGSFYWYVWLEGSGAVNIASTTAGSNPLYAKNNFVSGTPTGLPASIAGVGSGTSAIGWISTL